MKMDQRNSALDSIRGLAALFVIIYHSILYGNSTAVSVLVPPIQELTTLNERLYKVVLTIVNGHNAVVMFFVLSGFVLMLSMRRDFNRQVWSTPKFVVRRLLRLYPALIFALALCLIVGYLFGSIFPSPNFEAAQNILAVIRNMALLEIGVHGASWTIQVELLVVPFIIIGFWMWRLFGVTGVIICLALSMLEAQNPLFTAFSPTLSGFLFCFYAGMLAALMDGVKLESGITIVVLAAFCIFTSMFVSLNSINLLTVQVLFSCCLLYVLYNSADNFASRFLNKSGLVFLGKISYSLYLINVPIMWCVLSILSSSGLDVSSPWIFGILTALLTVAVSIPAAIFSEKYFERGGIALGRMLTTAKVSPALVPAE